ncbi:hypothetical protein TJA_03860 [Thermus sp. LT1-2-5]
MVAMLGLRFEYFEAKLSLYSDYETPFSFSGLSRFALVIFLWIAFAMSSVPLAQKVRMFFWVVGPSVVFQVLAMVSYAGLRFLELMTFVAPLVLLREYERWKLAPDRVFIRALIVAGVLGAVAVYRNFLVDYDGQLTGTLTPFLPYRTIFDRW